MLAHHLPFSAVKVLFELFRIKTLNMLIRTQETRMVKHDLPIDWRRFPADMN